MARFSPIQNAFNAGEWSPLMYGRADLDKYGSACRRMENFMTTVEGPAFARAGTLFVSEVKNSTHQTWLVRFEFSATDSYMLEFGDEYIRFYRNRAPLTVSGLPAWVTTTVYAVGDLVANAGTNYYCKTAHTAGATFAGDAANWYAMTGNRYEIPSPYAHEDLTDDEGIFRLRYAQTGDVIRFVHPDYKPYRLSRYGNTEWIMDAIPFNTPAFKDENITATTVYASATTGSVTLEASAALFNASHVGQYFFLREKDVRDTKLWEPGKSVGLGVLRRSDGKNYLSLNAATTGGNKPIHTTGSEYDGDTGVQWGFQDSGYGWVQITGYTNSTTVAATVISQIPDGAVTSGNATTRWAFEAWNADDGYPSSVTFFKERLVFARDQTIWFSVIGDFDNFITEIDGVISADAGFERTLSSDRVNSIKWLSPSDGLLVGTLGDEWKVSKATTTDPFGPNNAETNRQSTSGSNNVAPIRIGAETLFVQKAGQRLRSMRFRYEQDSYSTENLSKFARHLALTGIVDTAYAQEPWSVVWAVMSDGSFAGLTYDLAEDVFAWHNHTISGGMVECVEAIPSPDGSKDDPWFIVKLTVDSVQKRYICYMADDPQDDDPNTSWVYSDLATVYSGSAITTVTGADYLEGKTVWVLANGARHPNCVVDGGTFDLQVSATDVVYGLPCDGFLETMDIEGGAQTGTGQGKTKRCHQMVVRLNNSLGGKAGPNEANLEEIQYRTPAVPMGEAPPPYTGDVEIEWPGDYEKQMRILIKKDRPMPVTVVALMPQIVVQEGR